MAWRLGTPGLDEKNKQRVCACKVATPEHLRMRCPGRRSLSHLTFQAGSLSGGAFLATGGSSPASTQRQSVTHPCLCPLGPGSASLTTTALVFGLKPFSVLEAWETVGNTQGAPLFCGRGNRRLRSHQLADDSPDLLVWGSCRSLPRACPSLLRPSGHVLTLSPLVGEGGVGCLHSRLLHHDSWDTPGPLLP